MQEGRQTYAEVTVDGREEVADMAVRTERGAKDRDAKVTRRLARRTSCMNSEEATSEAASSQISGRFGGRDMWFMTAKTRT